MANKPVKKPTKEQMDEKRKKLLGNGLSRKAADAILKRRQRIKAILED